MPITYAALIPGEIEGAEAAHPAAARTATQAKHTFFTIHNRGMFCVFREENQIIITTRIPSVPRIWKLVKLSRVCGVIFNFNFPRMRKYFYYVMCRKQAILRYDGAFPARAIAPINPLPTPGPRPDRL